MSYDDLIAYDTLAHLPFHGYFKSTILVQILNDKDVVIHVDPAVLHQSADAGHVTAVPQSPFGIQRLSEDLRRQFKMKDPDSGSQF